MGQIFHWPNLFRLCSPLQWQVGILTYFLHMHVCSYVDVYAHVQRTSSGAFPQQWPMSTFLVRMGSLAGWELPSRLGWLSLPHQGWDYKCRLPYCFVTWGLNSPYLACKASTLSTEFSSQLFFTLCLTRINIFNI